MEEFPKVSNESQCLKALKSKISTDKLTLDSHIGQTDQGTVVTFRDNILLFMQNEQEVEHFGKVFTIEPRIWKLFESIGKNHSFSKDELTTLKEWIPNLDALFKKLDVTLAQLHADKFRSMGGVGCNSNRIRESIETNLQFFNTATVSLLLCQAEFEKLLTA